MSWEPNGGGRRNSKPQATALVALDEGANNALAQNYNDVREFRTTMQGLARYATILSPQMSAIQPGMSIALAVIEVADHELAPVSGSQDVQPTKSVINKVAAAAGVQWMPEHCYRTDDASDPLYCNYRAGGRRPGIDGSILPFYDEYELDLRPGSPKVVQAVAAAIKNNAGAYNAGSGIDVSAAMVIPTTRQGELDFMNVVSRYNALLQKNSAGNSDWWKGKLKEPFGGLNQQRAHLQSMAITKAKLRALRSALGMPIAGPKQIMTRFIVAVPFFSGEGLSKGVRERVEEHQAMQALAARQLLFGAQVQATPMRAFTAREVPAQLPRQPTAPPPIEHDPNFDPDSEPSWPGDTPSSVEPPPEVGFCDLPRDEQLTKLIALATERDLIGSGNRQCTEEQIRAWDDKTVAESWHGLKGAA